MLTQRELELSVEDCNLAWGQVIISRPRVARAGTNKLKCQKNIRCIFDQKPPQSGKFWQNFDGL